MNKAAIYLTAAGFLGLVACQQHVIIPPPERVVELECEFRGEIDDTLYEYAYGTNGYACTGNSSKQILPAPSPSSVTYHTLVSSATSGEAIAMDYGPFNWTNSAGTNKPSLAEFTNYFMNDTTPNYAPVSNAAGITITWWGPDGRVWTSDTSSFNHFTFTQLAQESDSTGDYMKFRAYFSCELLDTASNVKLLQNGELRSSFKLD